MDEDLDQTRRELETWLRDVSHMTVEECIEEALKQCRVKRSRRHHVASTIRKAFEIGVEVGTITIREPQRDGSSQA